MATQTKKSGIKKAVEYLTENKEFNSPVKHMVFSSASPAMFASEHTDAKIVSQKSYVKPFLMPDSFLEQAKDTGNFLDKNPLPQRD